MEVQRYSRGRCSGGGISFKPLIQPTFLTIFQGTYFRNAARLTGNLRLLAFLLSLPITLLSWSMVSFACSVSIYAFHSQKAYFSSIILAIVFGAVSSAVVFFWGVFSVDRVWKWEIWVSQYLRYISCRSHSFYWLYVVHSKCLLSVDWLILSSFVVPVRQVTLITHIRYHYIFFRSRKIHEWRRTVMSCLPAYLAEIQM